MRRHWRSTPGKRISTGPRTDLPSIAGQAFHRRPEFEAGPRVTSTSAPSHELAQVATSEVRPLVFDVASSSVESIPCCFHVLLRLLKRVN